ncbi:MAG: DUF420 domain-containing protein [Gemmataceae bacterium]|nr:DUF420 domain-containing protein [Gemmataceae bacterium]
MTPAVVLIGLKAAVALATLVLAAALTALARGNPRLHGRLNLVFVSLVLAALAVFELAIRLVNPGLMNALWGDPGVRQGLIIHLSFSLPATVFMLAMLATGVKRRTRVHKILAPLFLLFWIGTVVTGFFFLPNEAAPVTQASAPRN